VILMKLDYAKSNAARIENSLYGSGARLELKSGSRGSD
jgi:hypothetical protein